MRVFLPSMGFFLFLFLSSLFNVIESGEGDIAASILAKTSLSDNELRRVLGALILRILKDERKTNLRVILESECDDKLKSRFHREFENISKLDVFLDKIADHMGKIEDIKNLVKLNDVDAHRTDRIEGRRYGLDNFSTQGNKVKLNLLHEVIQTVERLLEFSITGFRVWQKIVENVDRLNLFDELNSIEDSLLRNISQRINSLEREILVLKFCAGGETKSGKEFGEKNRSISRDDIQNKKTHNYTTSRELSLNAQRFSDEEINEIEDEEKKHREDESLTDFQSTIRPSIEQQIGEDKEERLHGNRRGNSNSTKEINIDQINYNDNQDLSTLIKQPDEQMIEIDQEETTTKKISEFGIAMDDLIETVNTVVPVTRKRFPSKLKFTSERFLKRRGSYETKKKT